MLRTAGGSTARSDEAAEELARAIVHDCQRAVRRLDTLIGERNDVLLLQARSSIRRAASRAAALNDARAA
jgi:hypothetical protein